MTNEDLESIIERVNRGECDCSLGMLSESVGRGTVRTAVTNYGSQFIERDMFFLFCESVCVGLVYIADYINEDIHAFTLREHRNRGLTSAAFRDVILPELAKDFNDYHISVTSDEGAKLLRSLGYENATKGDEFCIDLKKYRK